MTGSEDIGSDVFLQEAVELVQAIERGLLDLESNPDNPERLNAVFRDLHTVKGSGAMFGHVEMAHFVHAFENAFDQLRRGAATVTPGLIAVALRACDQIPRLIQDPLITGGAEILAALEAELEVGKSRGLVDEPADMPSVEAETAPPSTLRFFLGRDALRLGTDPKLVLEELRGLGAQAIRALLTRVPSLDVLIPGDCLIGWEVDMPCDMGPAVIDDVFMFLKDDMELSTNRPDAPVAPVPAEIVSTAPVPVAPRVVATAAPGPSTMRVATERLDALMDRVGELVIAEARLQALAQRARDPVLMAVAEDIQRLAAGLRDASMSMRMVPIGQIFDRFRRLMRDLSQNLGKPFDFRTSGEDTEIDKTVIELLADPLVHILRNSADHGVETPAARKASGKPAAALIELHATYSGAEILITVRDDGRGLDPSRIRARAISAGLIAADTEMAEADLFRLIFEPGFSTAEKITEVSGRGVGMDVVNRTIATLRGQIELASEPGHGTIVTLRLPLTLAIIDGMLVEIGGEQYTIPLSSVEECVELPAHQAQLSSATSFLNIRGGLVPFLRVRELLSIAGAPPEYQKVVVVSALGTRVGLVVDRIVGNNQTVIKQLSRLHAGLKIFSGATILGDGSVALILDVLQLVAFGRAMETRSRRERAA